MLGVFAEFETNLRRERQLEGIAKAKAAGVYKGRVASIDADQVRKLKADGVGAPAIAKALNIGRASVYRVLGSAAQPLSGEAIIQFPRRPSAETPFAAVAMTTHSATT
jgi:DNA invertase Pin-like site-specific DNA recombinase